MKVFCTIVSRSHLSYAAVLADSLRASGNLEPLYVLVTDLIDAPLAADRNFVQLAPAALSVRFPERMLHYFDAFELCNALKPFLVSHLMREIAATHVIYLDSDLMVTAPFDRVWAELDRAALVLTPHQLTPPSLANNLLREIDIVDFGFINGGFAAWRAGVGADRILAWMRERFPVYGFCDRSRHMFVDQKLLPLLLAFFPEDVLVSRDPGLNVAYWNAHERPISFESNCWFVGLSPVVFFHLSGYKLSQPKAPCSYLERDRNEALLAAAPWLEQVLAQYHALLAPHFESHVPAAYRYSHFEGVKLNRPLRRLLFETGQIDRGSIAYWRIAATGSLRSLKRRMVGVKESA